MFGSAEATSNPRYIDAKHVWIKDIKIDLTDDKFLSNTCNPGMKILTIEQGIEFIGNNNNSNVVDKSIKFECMMGSKKRHDVEKKTLKNILHKKYYYNLENVNITIKISKIDSMIGFLS